MKPLAIKAARFVFGLRRPTMTDNVQGLAQRGEALADITFREPAVADILALAVLHVETWRSTYQDMRLAGTVHAPTYQIREHQWRDAFAKNDGTWFCYVAQRSDGELVGFTRVCVAILVAAS